MTAALRAAIDQRREPVAIVGMGCRLPGASSPAAFWSWLAEGRSTVEEIPAERSDLRIAARWGGFLKNLDRFDAAFFGISPREAERLDPQQRLLLETAWEALEDAGQRPSASPAAGPASSSACGSTTTKLASSPIPAPSTST